MSELLEAIVHDATASWYGFESQGRLGMLYFLKKINKLEEEKAKEIELEYEYMEDFSIYTKSQDSKEYTDIYQVKARKSLSNDDIKKVYGELALKQLALNNGVSVNLITRCEVSKNESYLEKAIEIYLDKFINELEILESMDDLSEIVESLDKTNSKSKIKTIRKIIRSKFKELGDINSKEEIVIECTTNQYKFKIYKENIENVQVNEIVDDFEKINLNIIEELKKILIKLEPHKEYKHTDEYLEKVRESLIYLMSVKLEDYVLNNENQTFIISYNDVIEIIRKDQYEIEETFYLYKLNQKINEVFKEYCKTNGCHWYSIELEECLNEQVCEINLLLKNLRNMTLTQYKSFLLNSNPNRFKEEFDFNFATDVLQSDKLINYVFEEFKNNKYTIDKSKPNMYLRRENTKDLFSFIDRRKKEQLERELSTVYMHNRHIYADNDSILNERLEFTYTPEITLAINQHKENDKEDKQSIIATSIDFKRI